MPQHPEPSLTVVHGTGAAIRAMPLDRFLDQAESIADSGPVLARYAACVWYDLDDDDKEWIAAIVRETLAVAADAPVAA